MFSLMLWDVEHIYWEHLRLVRNILKSAEMTLVIIYICTRDMYQS